MSLLVVGLSHHSAPVALLERVTPDPGGRHKLVLAVAETDHVLEVTVLATCNRLEIYTDVDRFHSSVEDVCRALCEVSDESLDAILPHVYVHYDDAAVSHLFRVAAGLDSMVVGEGQVLSQTRAALRLGQELGTVGPSLNAAFQQALRVAKRAHAETDIDRVAPSMVAVMLDRAAEVLGGLRGLRVLVVGAGSMAALAVSTLARQPVAELVVVNRTPQAAARLAHSHGGRPAPLEALGSELAGMDLVVSCTGAVGTVIGEADVRRTRELPGARRPMVLVDLALPHDVEPEVGDLPGVDLINLTTLAHDLVGQPHDAAPDATGQVRVIVAEEIAAFLASRRLASVTPTVVALRSMATSVVDAELERLVARLPDLDKRAVAEIELAVRRVADKLLHQPTVRVKELAGDPGTVSYATALAELFALAPEAVDAVIRPTEPRTPEIPMPPATTADGEL